ncbi:hypothetical protein Dimus_038452 [Dionaea muscipula]
MVCVSDLVCCWISSGHRLPRLDLGHSISGFLLDGGRDIEENKGKKQSKGKKEEEKRA